MSFVIHTLPIKESEFVDCYLLSTDYISAKTEVSQYWYCDISRRDKKGTKNSAFKNIKDKVFLSQMKDSH